MKKESERSCLRPRNALLISGIGFAISLGLVGTVQAQGGIAYGEADDLQLRRPPIARDQSLHGTISGTNRRLVEYFVRLDEPSVAELNAASVAQSGEFASSGAQKAQAERVSAQQAAFRAALEGAGARILSSQRMGANGFRVSAPGSSIATLRALPGVRSVGKVVVHTPDHDGIGHATGLQSLPSDAAISELRAHGETPNDYGHAHIEELEGAHVHASIPDHAESVPWIGATNVWAHLNIKGAGVKVGIIDSGIDYLHANFGGSGNPADYAANNRNVIEPGTFPTAKVVGGYDFAGPTYNANVADSEPTADPDPLDRGGHGSHVAGSVAGLGVPGSIGAGVAPEASLYALKVFGDAGGSTSLTSLAIEWAMDPDRDGDMSDHLDVINMSLGSAFGDPNDPTAISASNAAALGIVVVASAGNSGPTPYVTGAPAVAGAAISAAATIPGGRLYAQFKVTAPAGVAGSYNTFEGAGPVRLATVGPVTGNLVPALPANGCNPLTNAAEMNGNIALVIRGTCGFLVKFQRAQAAGARAIVVYNSGPPPGGGEDPFIMGGLNATVTIPGVMIPFSVGNTLRTTAGVAVSLAAVPDPTQDDRISDFSSQGPGGADSTFKPDLAAPGESIVSTAVGTGTGAANFSGTSMASPHVAGAAALLRQLHPKLNQAGIKALLQNATVNANASYDTKLTRQGVGSVRVDRAAALTSFASPGGVSFGRLNPLLPTWKAEKIEVVNLKQNWRNYTVTHVPNRTLAGVEVSCPSHVHVRGKHPAKAFISLKFDPRDSWAQGVADDARASQTEVDGWCVFSDGIDELRVGYIAVVDPASGVFVTPNPGLKKVTVRNLGPSLGWAEGFTLAKLGGEVADASNAIGAVGFRRADPAAYGFNVLEFGVATDKTFTHIANMIFDILVDTNADGAPDVELLAIDYSYLNPNVDPGTYVTAQFDATGAGFIDWEVRSWDFNDRTAILPFTFENDGGLLPEKFDYTLYAINTVDNTQDVQSGSVDMSREIVPDLNSFGVGPKDKIDVNMSGGSGVSLWLFQNNIAFGQIGLTYTK